MLPLDSLDALDQTCKGAGHQPEAGSSRRRVGGVRLTVDSDKPMPDGDDERHPEGTKDVFNVTNSGDSWKVV